jgi:hypothetical protein
MKNITIEIEIKVEVICSNKYGTLYQTSEGWHINGNKKRFIDNLKRDQHSADLFVQICASNALFLINNFKEI